jgi:hypothetical protein
MPRTVNKIIPARLRRPEKTQIAVNWADHRHRDLRIANSLMDENSDEVKLKKGSHAEVTVAAKNVSPP